MDTSPARPAAWHPTHLLLVLALWLGTLGNWPLWLDMSRRLPEQGWHPTLMVASWAVALSGVTLAFLCLWVWPRWLKVAGLMLLVASAAANYFMYTYGVVIDSTMVANALHTDAREVRDLLSPNMGAFAVGGVLLPGVWWWRQRVQAVGTRGLLRRQAGWALVGMALALVMLWLTFQDFASTMRNHKPLRYMINPFNTVYALTRHSVGQADRSQQPLEVVGTDATLRLVPTHERDAPLMVVVVGETARAANFGLSGYARDTTPRLSALQREGELVYFSDAWSCGTSTQVSVPCMFSDQGRAQYDDRTHRENLLDVVQRAGLAVVWIDNQSGCKGVCDRVPLMRTQALDLPGLCGGGECFDEVMLHVLPEQWRGLAPERRSRGTLVVLHQMGSHGPAYSKRTPANFKPFMPECDKANLQECSTESLVNTYDNTLRYTDHVIAETIRWLQAQSRPVALLYVSDHGESLGEKGLYLHGMPYRMAPDEQTHVPMLLWTNAAMRSRVGIGLDCLSAQATTRASHDHLFHTVLGLMGISTQAYRAEQDLTADCQTPSRTALLSTNG